MKKEEFNNQRFGANMKASYKGKGKYDIVGVDWETNQICLGNQGSEAWVSYKQVDIIEEPESRQQSFLDPQPKSRAYNE